MPRSTGSFAVARVALLLSLAGAAPSAAQPGFGQTFTAPTSPVTLLEQLAATALSGSGANALTPFSLSIFQFSGSTLGASIFTQSLGTSFSGFLINPNLTLNSGGLYAVLVNLPAVGTLSISTNGDFYTGGQAVQCTGTTCSPLFTPGSDVTGFSAQFGTTIGTVPEPGTWSLVGMGLLVIGGLAAKRKRVLT